MPAPWWVSNSVALDAHIVPLMGVERGHVDADTVVSAAMSSIRKDIALNAPAFSAYEIRDVLLGRVAELKESSDCLANLLTGESRGIQQRTPEWYQARKTMITASDAAQALGEGKFGTRREFFDRKIDAIVSVNPKPFNCNIPPLQWGIKYEPVAAYLYEHLFRTKLHEFGLLVHPEHSFIGASPDGINDVGIMVEIKCPYRRRIDGEVPSQYYMQMQLQMDVCRLQECDYLECEIEESDTCPADEFFVGKAYGSDGSYTYEFAFGEKAADLSGKPGRYFAVTKHNIVRVKRDDRYLKGKIDALRTTWDQLQEQLRRVKNGESVEEPSRGNAKKPRADVYAFRH